MKSIKYARFKTEAELLRSILYSLSADAYPKVSAIGGKKIVPDIDILEIQKVSQDQFRLIGYELKLMRFRKKSKGLSWSSFYSGIGEALLYLKNGVHRTVLVLGFHDSVLDDKLIDEFYNWLWDKRDLIKRIFGNHMYIHVHLYERGSISPPRDAVQDFITSDKEIQLLSNEMLQRKFTYDKKLKSN